MGARVACRWMLALAILLGVSWPARVRATLTSLQAAAVAPLDAPILMYHHVGLPRAGRFSVTPAQFAEQLKWLRDQGYHAVGIDDIAAAL